MTATAAPRHREARQARQPQQASERRVVDHHPSRLGDRRRAVDGDLRARRPHRHPLLPHRHRRRRARPDHLGRGVRRHRRRPAGGARSRRPPVACRPCSLRSGSSCSSPASAPRSARRCPSSPTSARRSRCRRSATSSARSSSPCRSRWRSVSAGSPSGRRGPSTASPSSPTPSTASASVPPSTAASSPCGCSARSSARCSSPCWPASSAASSFFDPRALALGLGLGSASMMLGGVGALSAIYPDRAAEITALAALSNLVTNIIGFYAGVFLSLPLCRRLYTFWSGLLRKVDATPVDKASTPVPSSPSRTTRRRGDDAHQGPRSTPSSRSAVCSSTRWGPRRSRRSTSSGWSYCSP